MLIHLTFPFYVSLFHICSVDFYNPAHKETNVRARRPEWGNIASCQ